MLADVSGVIIEAQTGRMTLERAATTMFGIWSALDGGVAACVRDAVRSLSNDLEIIAATDGGSRAVSARYDAFRMELADCGLDGGETP
jgi:predicted transcriptional regulator